MRILAALLFVVGLLLLAGLSVLILTGDDAMLAQLGLGVWSMCFFLAAIFAKVAEGMSKLAAARTETREDAVRGLSAPPLMVQRGVLREGCQPGLRVTVDGQWTSPNSFRKHPHKGPLVTSLTTPRKRVAGSEQGKMHAVGSLSKEGGRPYQCGSCPSYMRMLKGKATPITSTRSRR
jgi:hypothetical protein